jgi:hypothetical protein
LIYIGRSIRACEFVDKPSFSTESPCRILGKKELSLGDKFGIGEKMDFSRICPHLWQ